MISSNYQNTFDIMRSDNNKMNISISDKALNEIRIAAIKSKILLP